MTFVRMPRKRYFKRKSIILNLNDMSVAKRANSTIERAAAPTPEAIVISTRPSREKWIDARESRGRAARL